MRLAIGGTLDFARQAAPIRRMSFDISGNSRLFGDPCSTEGATAVRLAWIESSGQGLRAVKEATGRFTAKAYPFYLARLLGLFRDGKPQGTNTFITFNYDTVIEDALEELNVPFGYGWPRSLSTSWLLVVQSLTVPSLPPVARRRSSAAEAREKMSATGASAAWLLGSPVPCPCQHGAWFGSIILLQINKNIAYLRAKHGWGNEWPTWNCWK
jgi:hypothetical protein